MSNEKHDETNSKTKYFNEDMDVEGIIREYVRQLPLYLQPKFALAVKEILGSSPEMARYNGIATRDLPSMYRREFKGEFVDCLANLGYRANIVQNSLDSCIVLEPIKTKIFY
ncbi:MAG: hypothetical protein ACOCQX_03515 [Candidatus Nanoarchaeia archaeon]